MINKIPQSEQDVNYLRFFILSFNHIRLYYTVKYYYFVVSEKYGWLIIRNICLFLKTTLCVRDYSFLNLIPARPHLNLNS